MCIVRLSFTALCCITMSRLECSCFVILSMHSFWLQISVVFLYLVFGLEMEILYATVCTCIDGSFNEGNKFLSIGVYIFSFYICKILHFIRK